MKIFLSWSGERSRILAETLRIWLPDVVSFFEPWVSSEDIEKGARWAADLGKQLEDTDVGILCLTPENTQAPWILFEAGALSKALDRSRVCTYLLELSPSELSGPLVQFQATQTKKSDTFKLLRTLNTYLGDQSLPPDRLGRVFEHWWPELEKNINAIPIVKGKTKKERADRDLLEELLDLVREQAKSGKSLQPLSLVPFDNLFDGSDIDAFLHKINYGVELGKTTDNNAENWVQEIVKDTLEKEIDGVWASRWNQGISEWQTGKATLVSHGNYVMILHTDPEFEYFMIVKWRDKQILAGRHYNLRSLLDTSPWVGLVINENRIDGIWSRGRWDLRRPE